MKNIFWIVVFIHLSIISHAQEPDQVVQGMVFSAIIVSNLDASIDWYEKNLGFKIDNQAELASRGIRQANLSTNHVRLELIEIKGTVNARDVLQGPFEGKRLNGLFKIGFAVQNFEKTIKTLRQNHVKFQGDVVTDPITNQKMVIIRDPDDNRIQLFDG